MAEFLVKLNDNTHVNPTKDQSGCYKRGDVVVVMPNGHEWGKEEGYPKFVVVKIPGMTVAAGQKYIEPQIQGDLVGEMRDPTIITRRRKYNVLLDTAPQAMIVAARAQGYITVDFESIKNIIKNQATGQTE